MDLIKKLNEFIEENKFSNTVYAARGLNPSPKELTEYLESFFNEVAKSLLELAKDLEKKDREFVHERFLKSIIDDDTLERNEYDTEDAELIADYYAKLGEMLNVNIEKELNIWVYGFLPEPYNNSDFKIIINKCSNCNNSLETKIWESEGIPDFGYLIFKCNNCKNIDMMEFGPNIKRVNFVNYEMIIHLSKKTHTYDSAYIKLQEYRK